METARMTNNGYIQIPLEIRKKLNLKGGKNVAFVLDGNKIVIESAGETAFKAIKEAQRAFEGVAEEWGVKTEQDVVDYIKNFRKEIAEEKKRI